MNKTIHWLDFVRFMKDEDMWSRWEYQYNPEVETYFIANLILVSEGKTGHSFDFNKLDNVQVMSKDQSSLNWEHDGESLWHFYEIFSQGKRV